jgi:hypothetical protein
MGGVVDKIGQLVDGEPVLTTGKPSLLFLRKFKQGGTWEVSARAQGQYPVIADEATKARKVVRAASVGVLFPPKPAPAAAEQPGAVRPQSVGPSASVAEIAKVRLASEALHDRALDDVTREVAASWKRLHPAPAPTTNDAKK